MAQRRGTHVELEAQLVIGNQGIVEAEYFVHAVSVAGAAVEAAGRGKDAEGIH